MKTLFFLLLTSAALFASAADEKIKLPARENFHLILLAGQSNMAGRGVIPPSDRIPHPRVLMQNRQGEWVPAVEPVHYDKDFAGVGPGRSFAIRLATSDPAITVGLIPAACGGSPIASWQPGAYHEQTQSHPYDDAVRRTRRAMKDGTLKAILFHQGEADCYGSAPNQYRERLFTLIRSLRQELGAPACPFIIGQLSRFPQETWSEGKKSVDAAHRAAAAELPAVGFVSSEQLTSNPDRIHFDAPSQREFGRRYYGTYRRLTAPPSPVFATFTPILAMRDGNPAGLSRAQFVKINREKDQLRFAGNGSRLALKLPPDLKTFTVVMDVTLPKLPEKEGALFARPGCHNVLAVTPSGQLAFTIFAADRKTFCTARSETELLPNLPYRIAGTVRELPGGETCLTVHINGTEAGRVTLREPAFPYDGALSFGSAAPDGNAAMPLEYRLKNLWIFDRVLDGPETMQL